ncbi:outer membrane lipoprotein-sorting protein [Ferrimonas sp. YFM]|uniref:outer membrane lipoprotein-sorting protein n=1 Tax=Ferrimonas sp. YFM TaxID=3028878 RepID=UPI0025744EDE|nr:outer membrane lipoprotein-sorting protein [Ferrimonas sp. YFM]BDY04322.1 outer membrane lipoprotein-sorting protein [Ferrimonas sp. YFM]
MSRTLLLLLTLLPALVSAQSLTILLEQADQYRLQSAAAKVVSRVTLYEQGVMSKQRLYHVYTRPELHSLVLFKSPQEQGQKMLMLGKDYWLMMPRSRRPIRITPLQKLLGEASVGDISTLTWSDSYHPLLVSQDQREMQLELTAKAPGASYQKIQLWLEKDSGFPLRAKLYLHSGKLAKVARFIAGERGGHIMVIAMELTDSIQPGKRTLVEYLDITPTSLPDKYFNPAYLSRNRVDSL